MCVCAFSLLINKTVQYSKVEKVLRSWVQCGSPGSRITYFYLKEFLVWFAESLPVTGQTLALFDSNYAASEKCFIQTKPPSVYQSQYIYYTWNLAKTITTQFKLIEMSQTQARGACTHRDLKGMSYGKQNCLSLYTFRYLKAKINEIKYPLSILF